MEISSQKTFKNYSDTSLEIIVNDFFEKSTGLFNKDYAPLVVKAIKQLLVETDLTDVLSNYPEFPLIGDKWLDFTVGYKKNFAYEYDLSTRGLESPAKGHFFSDYKIGDEERILKPLDAMEFAPALAHRMKYASNDWTLAYCGLAKGRGRKFFRIALYYRGEITATDFFSALEALGFNYLTDDKRNILSSLITPYFDFIEVSLNLDMEGNLENYIGVTFNVPKVNNKPGGITKKLFDESGYSDFMLQLEDKGLIDSRWRMARESIYIKKYSSPFLSDIDGSTVINSIRGVKLSWTNDIIQQTKMYMDFMIGNS